jgi:hypothetical protein
MVRRQYVEGSVATYRDRTLREEGGWREGVRVIWRKGEGISTRKMRCGDRKKWRGSIEEEERAIE